MKIAVISSGILPVPAVQGGAVENLIDFYLEYNERHQLHDITVYSAYHPEVKKHHALLSKVNHHVYIKTHNLWFRLCAKVFGITHPNCYYFYQLDYFFKCVFRKIKKSHYDLVVLENRPGVAIQLSKWCHTPIITHLHTNLVNPQTPQVQQILSSTTKFLVVSNYLRKQIESIDCKTNIQIVYNGLDDKHFNRKSSKTIDRKRFGFNEHDFVVIYTGRIVPQKGVKELLQAVLSLSNYPEIKLLVVGGDNFGDSVRSNPYIDDLTQMACKANGRIVLTGFVPYPELPSYLAIADVAVVPSRINEALGMTCIEACAMGLPVIATNDGGIPETLVGQKHILIEKDEDLPSQIAKAIVRIKDNYADFMGNSNSEKFSKEVYTDTFFKAIEGNGI